jgi:hypothetical protein
VSEFWSSVPSFYCLLLSFFLTPFLFFDFVLLSFLFFYLVFLLSFIFPFFFTLILYLFFFMYRPMLLYRNVCSRHEENVQQLKEPTTLLIRSITNVPQGEWQLHCMFPCLTAWGVCPGQHLVYLVVTVCFPWAWTGKSCNTAHQLWKLAPN